MHMVSVDSRRSRPITLYRRQESLAKSLAKNNSINAQSSKADAAMEAVKKWVFNFYVNYFKKLKSIA